ncbi:Hsp20/alpha crystallin family protein [Agathobaculum desmolans]|uniref:Hsp20/alpha crystallin family protein n=1 Tax=Agathobaculum desmolans TaxID=39484 RepID=UPI00248F12FF|nr:Hsp20/alpha crystallin family protein [Agathobaculum desmolans]
MLPAIFGENLFDDFFDDFDALDKRFFGKQNPLYGKHAKNLMKTDVKEKKNEYVVSIDLPGFKKDEINVDLRDGYLTVSASKGLDKEEKNEDERYIRQERYSGACSRSFYVGEVKPADVKCKYEFGVLKITVPKTEAVLAQPEGRIAIE